MGKRFRIIPFGLWPANWGLEGKRREEAKLEYYWEGEDLAHKKNELLQMLSQDEPVQEKVTEEDGRKQLMDLIDEHVIHETVPVGQKANDVVDIEKKYQLFLKKIQKRALDYHGRL